MKAARVNQNSKAASQAAKQLKPAKSSVKPREAAVIILCRFITSDPSHIVSWLIQSENLFLLTQIFFCDELAYEAEKANFFPLPFYWSSLSICTFMCTYCAVVYGNAAMCSTEKHVCWLLTRKIASQWYHPVYQRSQHTALKDLKFKLVDLKSVLTLLDKLWKAHRKHQEGEIGGWDTVRVLGHIWTMVA